MEAFRGRTAVVAGVGSGIGQERSLELAKSGAALAISDVDSEGLARTERQVRQVGAEVRADRLDVTQRADVLQYAEQVRDHFGVVNQIYNIAGIGYFGDVVAAEFKDVERLMDIDFWGVVNGTKAFLPHLIESGDGHVLNMSSMFGLMAMPGGAFYAAAKFAVRGFSEALRQELMVAKLPVAVTVAQPGMVKTNIAVNSPAAAGVDKAKAKAIDDLARMAPTNASHAARVILRAVAKKKPRVLVGPDARVVDMLVRVTGPGYQKLLLPMTKRMQFWAGVPITQSTPPAFRR